MKKMYVNVSGLVLSCLILLGCQLNSEEVIVAEKEAGADVKKIPDKEATIYPYGEVYSRETIEAELQAIEKGYEPPAGVEERIELLEQYRSMMEDELLFVVSQFFPIKLPRPICPPRPVRDCRAEPETVNLTYFSLTVFCEDPDIIEASITTEEGVYAELAETSFNGKEATLRFEVVQPELSELESLLFVKTGILIEGELRETVINMQVYQGIFMSE